MASSAALDRKLGNNRENLKFGLGWVRQRLTSLSGGRFSSVPFLRFSPLVGLRSALMTASSCSYAADDRPATQCLPPLWHSLAAFTDSDSSASIGLFGGFFVMFFDGCLFLSVVSTSSSCLASVSSPSLDERANAPPRQGCSTT